MVKYNSIWYDMGNERLALAYEGLVGLDTVDFGLI